MAEMVRASSGVPLVWLVWLQAGPGAGSLGTSHWPRNRRGEQWHLYRTVVWYLFRIPLISPKNYEFDLFTHNVVTSSIDMFFVYDVDLRSFSFINANDEF